MKQEFIKLTDEQKEQCKRIVIYADEFENNERDEIWQSYCDILGVNPSCEQIEFHVCGCTAGTVESDIQKLSKDDIKHVILYDLKMAFNHKDESMYWLERLPRSTTSDYDETVKNFIDGLYWHSRRDEIENVSYTVNDLVEHYYINQDDYDFSH